MSEENKPVHYHAFEITEKGMELRQKAIAGGDNNVSFKIDFTRGAIGIGRPEPNADIYFMTGLISPAASVPIKESYAKHVNHLMTIIIDNSTISEELLMTEIGIFARLIDSVTGEELIPEVLYGYTYTYKYDYIPTSKNYFMYREITFNTVLSRSGKFEIIYDKSRVYVTRQELESKFGARIVGYDNTKSKLLAVNLQEAVDELSCCNLIDAVIYHNLDTYPNAVVFEIINGYGQNYGSCGYGGFDFKREIKSRVVVKDRNTIQLLTETEYSGAPEVERISAHEYILNFEKARLFVTIITNYNDKKLHLDIQNLTVRLNEVDRNSTTRDIQLDANTKNLSDKLFETNRNLNLKDADLEEEIRNLKSKMSSFSHLYDEEIESLRRTHLIDSAIYHNLGAYPMIIVYEVVGGYGTSGYGTEKYGNVHSHVEIKSRVIPIDRNTIKISTEKKYKGTPKVQRLNRNEFQIVYPDNITLFVQLFVLSTSQPAVVNAAKAVTSFNGRAGDVVMDKTDVIGFIDNALSEFAHIDDGEL